MTDAGVPGPGWYPDPWFTGQHRYWTGATWTGDVFPDGPAGHEPPQVTLRPEGQRPPVAPPTQRSPSPLPPPTFGYGAAQPVAAPTTVLEPWELLESAPDRAERRRLSPRHLNAIALLVGLVIGFVVVAAVVRDSGHRSPSASLSPTFPTPFPTFPITPSPQSSAPASSDPDASVLPGLVVRQGDVPASNSVQLLPAGNRVAGQTTLDLCNGTYPSEALRTARLQVVEYLPDNSPVLSTEAVLYRTAADAGQGMKELASVVASCPGRPVVSPVGEQTVTTKFQAAPDGSWPKVDSVQRQAYAFTTTGSLGGTDDHIAVYLRRGRVLEGLYFSQPKGAQPAVDGQTTVAGIVAVFEHRIAALPSSVTKG